MSNVGAVAMLNPEGIRGIQVESAMRTNFVRWKASAGPRELQILDSEMRARQKSLTVAYLTWLVSSFFLFVYRFYLKRDGSKFLAVSLISLVCWIIVVGIFATMVMMIIWIVDAFRLPRFVEEYNLALESQIIGEIVAAGATAPAV
jgi:TM2 domain-containing membrane protein YozV